MSTRENGAASQHEAKPICGIVMPIADTPGYVPGHWNDVLAILSDAVMPDFEARLVSSSDEVTVIHKTIIQNLYSNEMVVCDVSGKNPNVMFELGMRLTFDRPTIIVIDDATEFSFDTGPIEHIRYPVNLRFQSIVDFKEKLRRKAVATFQTSSTDNNYSPFLKHFGQYIVSGLETTELSANKYLLEEISGLRKEVSKLSSQIARSRKSLEGPGQVLTVSEYPGRYKTVRLILPSSSDVMDASDLLLDLQQEFSDLIESTVVGTTGDGRYFVDVTLNADGNLELLSSITRSGKRKYKGIIAEMYPVRPANGLSAAG